MVTAWFYVYIWSVHFARLVVFLAQAKKNVSNSSIAVLGPRPNLSVFKFIPCTAVLCCNEQFTSTLRNKLIGENLATVIKSSF